MKNNNGKSINEILSEISDVEKIEFEKKWKEMLKGWEKNGICVIVFKFVFFLGF
jgi:hypothetical protein